MVGGMGARRSSAASAVMPPATPPYTVEGHGDDLALELRHARAHVPLEGVHVGEPPEGLGQEPVVLVIAAVHRPRALARLPERVLFARDRRQLSQHLLAWPAALGERAVDCKTPG